MFVLLKVDLCATLCQKLLTNQKKNHTVQQNSLSSIALTILFLNEFQINQKLLTVAVMNITEISKKVQNNEKH